MSMKLKDKVSIVTGGGSGIGRATCLAFAKEGSNVLVADIVLKKAEEVARDIRAMGLKSISFGLDVANGKQVKEMVNVALHEFGRIDILANIAGIIVTSAIEDVSEEDWDRVMAVNLKGTFLCCQAVGREMIKKRGGSIINIASIAGHTPQLHAGAYSSSKAGVILLTQLMAVEWAKYNIRVNAISPGVTRTPITDDLYNTEALRNARAKMVPMNRFGSPEEIAAGFVFLASDESSFVTGHPLIIDGGSISSVFHAIGLLSLV